MMNRALSIMSTKALLVLLESGEAGSKSAAIICSSHEIDHNRLSRLPVLCLRFDDTENAFSRRAFSHEMARQIVRFVDELPQHVQALYVTCDSGESRSAAIAAAVLSGSGQSDMIIWKNPKYRPNSLVYRYVREAYSLPVTHAELLQRTAINEEALRYCIAQARKT